MENRNMSGSPRPTEDESLEERTRRLEQQRVRPEDEERKSADGPATQVTPEVEPSGS
jgi:hypothetical protein